MEANTNNTTGYPNTIHYLDLKNFASKNPMTFCKATSANLNNSTQVHAKVTCKRCLAKLAAQNQTLAETFHVPVEVITHPPEYNPELEAYDPIHDPEPNPEPEFMSLGAEAAKDKKAKKVTAPKPTKPAKVKTPNVHLFYGRDPQDLQKNGVPRPSTLCSIAGATTMDLKEVTCKVCQSVMQKNAPKTHGESK